MVHEQQLRLVHIEPVADVLAHPELVAHPRHHRVRERTAGARVALQRGQQDALELHEGLLVEDDVIQVLCAHAAGFEAVADCTLGKPRVVLLTREALFFGGGDEPAVFDERGGCVVIEAGDTENSQGDGFSPGCDAKRRGPQAAAGPLSELPVSLL